MTRAYKVYENQSWGSANQVSLGAKDGFGWLHIRLDQSDGKLEAELDSIIDALLEFKMSRKVHNKYD